MPRGAVVSISHGGGPMPILGDPGHKSLVQSLRKRVPRVLKLDTPDAPHAIVVVTAHWSTAQPTISVGATHDLLYGYSGFPPEAYNLRYPAPGSPEVAKQVKEALDGVGFETVEDKERVLLIAPAATIPIVQLSVLESEDHAAHLRMGRALATLRDRNIAIIGSGFASFHNLKLIFQLMSPPDPATQQALVGKTKAWNAALTEAVTGTGAREDREAKLLKWREFPSANDMHPQGGADHFMPLLVCVGAGGEEKGNGYVDEFYVVDAWSFYWE